MLSSAEQPRLLMIGSMWRVPHLWWRPCRYVVNSVPGWKLDMSRPSRLHWRMNRYDIWRMTCVSDPNPKARSSSLALPPLPCCGRSTQFMRPWCKVFDKFQRSKRRRVVPTPNDENDDFPRSGKGGTAGEIWQKKLMVQVFCSCFLKISKQLKQENQLERKIEVSWGRER